MKRFLSAFFVILYVFSLSACKSEKIQETASEQSYTLSSEYEVASTNSEPSEYGVASTNSEPSEQEQLQNKIDEFIDDLTLEEKVGQLFFVRCPQQNAQEDISTYHLGGYVLFLRDFKDTNGKWLNKKQFTEKIKKYQSVAKIPLLIGVDEEGGKVVRASLNPNLFPNGSFLSPQELLENKVNNSNIFYDDAASKSKALLKLGINVNLAPVADVSVNSEDFIYGRALGQNAEQTAEYVSDVVAAMRRNGIGSVLKHFPGYGNNVDTHTGIARDKRDIETFRKSDFLPFSAGITAGGKSTSVMVSHNIVECMDNKLPASLSAAVHETLRKELGFDGVVMTDDLAMDAVAAYSKNGAVAVMAIKAGNDIVISTDYRTQIPKVIKAVKNGELDEDLINTACSRVISWKIELGILKV